MSHEHRQHPERFYDDEGEAYEPVSWDEYVNEPEPIVERCCHCDGTGWRAIDSGTNRLCKACHGTGQIEYVP